MPVSEARWKLADKVAAFLHSAAFALKYQSGPNYVTMSVLLRVFDTLEESFMNSIEE